MKLPILLLTLLFAGSPAFAVKPVTKKKRTPKATAVRKATVTKTPVRRRVSRPVVYVSPTIRRVALESVSARALQPVSALEGAGALVPFFEQMSHPSGNSAMHIMQYGDSHTASDDWADTLRQAMQRKFGVGGPGFTLAGHPFAGYRRFDSRGTSSRGWYTDGLVGHPGDGAYGLGGVSLTTQSAGETVTLTVECEQLELHYLQQPSGGRLQFAVDDLPSEIIDTGGDLAPAIYRFTPSAGQHEYSLRTLDHAPVRLFGWSADNHAGVTYETFGINGAHARQQLDWDQSILASEMASHDPVLIVVAYGTNEALNKGWTVQEYATAFGQVIQRLRADAPLASILVVGPPDCETRFRGRRVPFPRLDEVIEIQREVARLTGCAFWDWRGRMGGAGSVREWVQAGLGQGDYVHMTPAGYRLVGSMLFDELMAQYNRFVTLRAEAIIGH
jgi:lysophospholipase L1-like esterase